jgi:ADP-heptose:LPS heptosyltransferase
LRSGGFHVDCPVDLLMLPRDSTPRLLVRVPSWLGDLVMSEPAVRALYEHYERADAAERITLAGPQHLLGVWDAQFPRARRSAFAGRTGDSARAWRGHDVALLLNNSIRSAWTALAAGIPRRCGWSRDIRALLLTDGIVPPREQGGVPLGIGKPGAWPRWLPRPYTSACIELVQRFGVPVRDPRPRLVVSAAARATAAQRLAGFGLAPAAPFVLVNAGGRPDSAKSAPAWLFAPALRALWERERVASVLVCGPGEERVLEALHGRLGGAESHACTAPIAELSELAALCERARVVLTADGGPRHIAQAVGARVACVCGPTDPRHSDAHSERTRVLRAVVPCGPCHLERCPLPRDTQLACWHELGAERVTAALLADLDSPGPKA